MRNKVLDTKEEAGLSQKCSLAAKGIFIILLLMHHLFYGDAINVYHISTVLIDTITLYNWSIFGRVCIGGFAFITAYGMTKQIRGMEKQELDSVWKVCMRRFIKIESSCCLIYALAVLYKRFVMQQSIKELYSVNGFKFSYMIIDALGLADLFKTPQINVTWWYLSFYVLLIFAMPAFFKLYKKTGIFLAFAILLLIKDNTLTMVILGIAFAYENWFEKMEVWVKKSIFTQVLNATLCVFLLWIFYEIVSGTQTADYINMIAGGLIIWMSIIYFSKIPILSRALEYIGKHSGNIFLIHTFIYYYFYSDFIYSFKKAILIVFVLLGCSLMISCILEFIKSKVHYNMIIDKIIKA